MELTGNEVRVFCLRQLDDFHELAVRRDAGDHQSGRDKRGPPFAVVRQLVAVAVSLGDDHCIFVVNPEAHRNGNLFAIFAFFVAINSRGVEGKIAAIKYAREKKIPFLGICLGMQCTVIEYARDVLGWKDANSTEFDEKTAHPVIDLMEEQRGITQKGGTMRLGAYPCVIKRGTLADKLYSHKEHKDHKVFGETMISERHRHRYELAYDSEACERLEAAGLKVSGLSPDGKLVEIVELPSHPYFIAGQFHPEFKSRPTAPHPLFLGLVAAALKGRKRK